MQAKPLRILFVCKRRPQGRDLIERPHGRFFHIPSLMAAHGFDVKLALLNYQTKAPPLDLRRNGMDWSSRPITRYISHLNDIARHWQPDWIIGLSDTWYGILAQRLASRYKTRCAIDAYDNYEGYMPWALPLHYVWRKALAAADLTIAAGPHLSELMNTNRPGKAAVVAPMAVDPIGYKPLPRRQCRQQLGLPIDGQLFGYCGSITAARGIKQLFAAAQQLPQMTLVLSGRIGPGITLPAGSIHLGYLPDAQLPLLYNALNVLTVINRDSKFGNSSHPIKLYEAIACQIPVVATDTPATRWILHRHHELLTPFSNPGKLAATIATTARINKIEYPASLTWQQSTAKIIDALQTISDH